VCHLLPDFDRQYPRESSTRSGACLRQWYEYLRPAQSEEETISDDYAREHIERTLKTTRILLRSDFQAVIVSLSFLA